MVDDDGRGLVWTGEGRPTPTPGSPPAIDQARAPLAYTPPYLAEKILTSKRVLEGERKHVTVLFADLKGSMELLADRDPEEARQLLDPVLTLMMDAVHRYEGTVNQVMGDGIMALFGAPVAHEDHAVRACYAALAMQDAIGRYREEVRRTHGIEVHIRVGLNSGAVVVRAIDSSLHMDYTAVGQTTHLAARMEQLALPGSIRLTVETLRLAEGFIEVKALAYARQAGEKAMARSAHREAVGSFKQALSALAHLPETRDTHEQAIDLRLALRTALYPSGDAGRILAVLRQAEALAEALDDHHRLGQVLLFLSNHFYHGGAYDQAIAAGQRVLAFATAGRDAVLHARANNYLGLAYLAQTDYRQAIDCFGQTVAALDGARRHERFGQANLPAVISRANLAWCHAELGIFAEGRALGDEGLRIAEAVAHPASLMVAYYGIGLRSLLQGDLPEALPRLERAVGICQDADLPGWFPRMAAPLGAAYTLAGRVADAVPLLTQALAQTTARERGDFQALCRLPRGEVQLLAGHLEEAPTLAKRALTHARAHQEHGHQAYALRLLGEIAARREPPETALADAHYHQALALAEALGMRPLVAHYHRGFGTLYAKIGHRAKARAALSAAAELYRAMAMTCWLPQAETALAEVEGH